MGSRYWVYPNAHFGIVDIDVLEVYEACKGIDEYCPY
jgi:hypothetical protein